MKDKTAVSNDSRELSTAVFMFICKTILPGSENLNNILSLPLLSSSVRELIILTTSSLFDVELMYRIRFSFASGIENQ